MNASVSFPCWEPSKWTDCPANPLIAPVSGAKPRRVIGDPQVILPGEFDDRWHMFLIGEGKFYRFDSSDGVKWTMVYDLEWSAGPMCITADGTKWIVLYTQYDQSANTWISARTSMDLVHWSEPADILHPEYAWERESRFAAKGRWIQVRNPCLVRLANGKWRLYYSGGTVWLDDCGYEEPKYIGYAEADEPLGKYWKHPEPILGPDVSNPHRNLGAGAMKVFQYESRFIGLENGIYRDCNSRSRSAINVVLSDDGVVWEEAPYNPIVAPTDSGWKKALVYQLDLRWHDGKLWLFYNARDEWKDGVERIGLSTMPWDGPRPEKMWVLPAAR